MKPQVEFYQSKKAIIIAITTFTFCLVFGGLCVLFPDALTDPDSRKFLERLLFKSEQTTQYTGYGFIGIFSILLLLVIMQAFNKKPLIAVYDDHLSSGKVKIERSDISAFEFTTFVNVNYLVVKLKNPHEWIQHNAKNTIHKMRLNKALEISDSPIMIPATGLKRTPEEIYTLLEKWYNSGQ